MIRCIALMLATAFLPPGARLARGRPRSSPTGQTTTAAFATSCHPGPTAWTTPPQLALFEATGQAAGAQRDQLQMYSNLTTAAGSITGRRRSRTTSRTPPSASRPVTSGPPRAPSPESRSSATRAYGVPHIYGDTRAELMFGIGYATAEDRLFFIDVLRHAGQGDLASFAGGANVAMDESVWATEPYTQQDLVNQVNYHPHGPDGAQVYADATNYVNGINAYIEKAKQPLNMLTMMPAEYAAIGQPPGPQLHPRDLVSIATLVGGIFGNGGGDQLSNAMLYESLARSSARALRRPRLADGDPQGQEEAPRKRASSGRTSRRSRPATRDPQRPRSTSAATSKKKKTVDHSGFGTFLSFDRPTTPRRRRPSRTRFNYQSLPRPPRRWRGRSRCPTLARSSTSTARRGGAAPRAQARAAAGIRGTALGPRPRDAGQRRSRAAVVPAHDVQRAAGQRQGQRQRPSAGGDGTAGVVLRRPRS